MINSALLNLDHTEPYSLTVLLIGTEDALKLYIHRQHSLGVNEVGAWSKLMPVPNCPGKVMSILHKTTP